MRRFLPGVLFLFLFISLSNLFAINPINIDQNLRRQVVGKQMVSFEDRAGILDIETLRQKDRAGQIQWRKSKKDSLGFGATRSAIWIKFALQNKSKSAVSFLLQESFTGLDHIQLYAPDTNNVQEAISTGDMFPFVRRPYPHRTFIFPLRLEAGATRIFYFRVTSSSVIHVRPLLRTEEDLRQADENEWKILRVYGAAMAIVSLFCLSQLLTSRRLLYLNLAVYIIFVLLLQAYISGYGFEYLWPGAPWLQNHAILLFMCGAILAYAQFIRIFVLSEKISKLINSGLLVLMLSVALCAGYGAFGKVLLAFRAVSLLNLAGILFTLVLLSYLWLSKNSTPAKVTLISLIVLLVGIGVSSITKMKLLPANILTDYAGYWGVLAQSLILSSGLRSVPGSYNAASKESSPS